MKVSFINIGCKVNFAEMAQIQEQFVHRGYEIVDFGEPCDAVFINTCTVTKHADSDSRKYIRRAIRKNRDSFVGVMGCYAQLEAETITGIDGVDAVFGTNEKFHINELMPELAKQPETKIFVSESQLTYFEGASSEDDPSHTRIVFKIQDGCDYYCSYCAVPYARGRSRSMPIDEIAPKLLEFQEHGYHEIILSGINLGEYRSSEGKRFIDVIKLIESIGMKSRIRISSIEPNLLSKEIIDIVSTSKVICPHFHIPLQSGSAHILKLMGRRYTISQFEDTIFYIKDKIPDCCLGIDVITGFPGETDAHFTETYQLLESLPVSYLHVFSYSEREITKSAGFPNKVHSNIIKERTLSLRKLSEQKKKQFYDSQISKVQTIIPEVYNPEDGMWKGWSENYVRVEFFGKAPQTKHPKKIKLIENRTEKVFGEQIL
jgi:threonylcarbamoyladenosine tRNA methylthiotransferase MtaB